MFTVNQYEASVRNKASVVTRLLLVLLICASATSGLLAADNAFHQGADGLRFKDLQVGRGPAASPGQVATVHFVGWIDEQGVRGRELYNTRAQGQPVSFVIGTDGVMEGWNQGVLGMQVGGKRMLLVPPGLAYGNRSVEGIVPANSALMFRFELIGLEDPDS